MASTLEVDNVDSLKVVDLRKHLESRGLSKTGKKGELVERLKNALENDIGNADNVTGKYSENSEQKVEVDEQSNSDSEINNGDNAENSALDDYQHRDEIDIHAEFSDDDIESNSNLGKSYKSVADQEKDEGEITEDSTTEDNKNVDGDDEKQSAQSPLPKKKKWGGTGTSKSSAPYITSKSLEELIPAKRSRDLSPEVANTMRQMAGEDAGVTVDLTADDDEVTEVVTVQEEVMETVTVEEGEVSADDTTMEEEKDMVSADVHSDVESDGDHEAPSQEKHRSPVKASRSSRKTTASVRLRETKAIGYLVEEPVRERSPSPAKFEQSDVLNISGLVRPFTDKQLRELLSRYGELAEETPNFWMDRIKTKAYAIFRSPEMAAKVRLELDGCRWPPVTPLPLKCDFSTREEFTWMLENGDSTKPIPKRANRLKEEPRKHKDVKPAAATKTTERKRRASSATKSPERKKEGKKEETVREWDRGKKSVSSSPSPTPPPVQRGRAAAEKLKEKEKEKERKEKDKDKDKDKEKKKEVVKDKEGEIEEKQPARLLDQLFYKTKSTPCIYWLPLTEETAAARDAKKEAAKKENEALMKERKEREKAKAESMRQQRMQAVGRRDRRGRSRSRSRDRRDIRRR